MRSQRPAAQPRSDSLCHTRILLFSSHDQRRSYKRIRIILENRHGRTGIRIRSKRQASACNGAHLPRSSACKIDKLLNLNAIQRVRDCKGRAYGGW